MDIINDSSMGRRRVRLALMLGALSAFPALTIDMYLPGMPVMADDLNAGAGLVQLTVTVFVVGLAAGQVMVGPLSDAWGRRPLLVGGLGTYVGGAHSGGRRSRTALSAGAEVRPRCSRRLEHHHPPSPLTISTDHG